LEELARRIQRYPDIIHRQGAIVYLIRARWFKAARQVCEDFLQEFPDHWWPNLAQAVILAELRESTEGERRFRAWCEKDPSFLRFCFLAHYHEDRGEREATLAALRRAVRLPVRYLPDEADMKTGQSFGELVLDAYLLHATASAFRARDHDLVLSICDHWEQFCRDHHYANEDC